MMEHKMNAIAAGSGGDILESPLRDSSVGENISTSSAASMYRELDETMCPGLGISLMDVPNLMMILAGFNPL